MRIIDAHAHVWLQKAADDRRDLIDAVETVPLEEVWTSGLAGQYPDEATVRAVNEAVAVLLEECGRARGFAYLNPRHGEAALEEMERCLDGGFSGVKLWIATRADDPLNFPVYERAITRGIPVLLHCFDKQPERYPDETGSEHLAEAARRYPECAFIMAHVAAEFVSGADNVAGLRNVCADISGSYGENRMVEYAAGRMGADRILFGTDMPGSDIYHNLGKVLGADISEEDRDRILYRNARELLP